MFNPIGAIIETCENTKQNHSDKNQDNKCNWQKHNIFQMSGNNNVGFVTTTIIKFHFAQKLKIYRTLMKLKL